MARPPRVDAPGAVFFTTTATWQRRPLLAARPIAHAVIDVLLEQRDESGFELFAWVLMPDHAHVVIQPMGRPLEEAMRRFKSLSWRRCRSTVGLVKRLWQSGFHDRGIRNERALRAAIDYVHLNPVRAGLAEHPEEWEWSSYRAIYQAGGKPRPLREESPAGGKPRPAAFQATVAVNRTLAPV